MGKMVTIFFNIQNMKYISLLKSKIIEANTLYKKYINLGEKIPNHPTLPKEMSL